MTNTKPTWEEEFDSEFSELNEKGAIKCKRQYIHPCIGWHSPPYLDKDEEKRINANGLKAFIKKVEQEAENRGYERGYEKGEEDESDRIRYKYY